MNCKLWITLQNCTLLIVLMTVISSHGMEIANKKPPVFEIFHRVGTPTYQVLKINTDPAIIRSGDIIPDQSALNSLITTSSSGNSSYRIHLPLFQNADFIAQMTQMIPDTTGGVTLVGNLEGIPSSEAALVYQQGLLAGYINLPGLTYQIRPVSLIFSTIFQVNQNSFPDEQTPLIKKANPASPKSLIQITGDDDGSRIDLLVVYDQAAQSEASGDAQVQVLIKTAIAETNNSYTKSLVNQRISLVGTALVNYDETKFNWVDALQRLTNPSDGYMDSVQPLRDATSADIVILMVAIDQPFCGISWQMDQGSESPAENAYGVVSLDCSLNKYSLSHELGHLMGSQNDRDNSSTPGMFPYSYGYQDALHQFRTIMADNKGCNCERINYWSNPQVTYLGFPTGNYPNQVNEADNALSLNNTALLVANFRDGPPPLAPSQLVVTPDYLNPLHPTMHLMWKDNSEDETRFEIERSPHNLGAWSALTNVDPNSTEIIDVDPPVNQVFDYRLRAHSGNGNSNYSNIATGSTTLTPAAPINLVVSALDDENISLVWEYPPADIKNFGVPDSITLERLSENSTTWGLVAVLPGTSTTYTDQHLLCSTPYHYRIQTVNSAGKSPYAITPLVTTSLCTTPSPPDFLTVEAVSPTSVSLSWGAGHFAQLYKIERLSAPNGQWIEISQVDGFTLTFMDINLTPGTQYGYRIRSSNPAGDSEYSNQASVRTPWYTNFLAITP